MTASQARETVWRVAILYKQPDYDVHAKSVLHDIRDYGLAAIARVRSSRLFFLRGPLAEADVNRIGAALLADPVTESFEFRPASSPTPDGGDCAIEVHLKPGVMDPVAGSTITAIRDMGLAVRDVRTGRRYVVDGATGVDQLEFVARRVLANECIEDVFVNGFGRQDRPGDVFREAPVRPFQLKSVPIRDLDDDALRRLSREGHLFLSLEEMKTIQSHFRSLGREPTDLELETLAQTWSEHCVHKTLKSAIVYRGEPLPAQKATQPGDVVIHYDNLLKDTIARATHELIEEDGVNWCLSVFEDNAGVIAFDDEYAIAFKVETHNHPSAIEPYGGSATGIGGVIRDIMGVGLGAKPVANTDVFCVGMPDFPIDLLPAGVLHPRRVLKGIVSGVRDYGNRMGIPTVNGAVYFDPRYMGNPLVFCGCVGLMPRNAIAKAAKPGDLVVVVGGRTGRDGIHGATFSSAELTDSHADEFAHAVQIGNAITEKKVLDTQLQARDHASGCLYTACTDCGAGGLSSAVGEMGQKIGAAVDLEKVPLKYAGLRYDEIWISEAQERMVLSVPPENWPAVKAIFDAEDVEATAIGTFGTENSRLIVRYQGAVVGELAMDFLHDGIPRTKKEAIWRPSVQSIPAPAKVDGGRQAAELKRRLGELNNASKEWIIRQYDHEVQGGSTVKPLTGPRQGPSDAAVVRPRLGSDRGIAIGCGLCPHLAEIDPYWMALHAVDEAIRNVVCVGADPSRTAILDNFCWGNCEDPEVLGSLVRACQACYEAAKAYGTPFISGKDSLNNEFALDPADAERLRDYLQKRSLRLVNNRLRIPSTLLISAIGLVHDAGKCVTADAKASIEGRALEESSLWLLGVPASPWPAFPMKTAAEMHRAVYRLIQDGAVLAAHDFSEDGYAVAIAEMAIGGDVDCEVWSRCCPPVDDPFSPWASGYIVQVTDAKRLESLAKEASFAVHEIGAVFPRETGKLMFAREARSADEFPMFLDDGAVAIDDLREAWRSPLRW